MKTYLRKEFLIGVSALCALAILFFGIDFLKGVNVFQASNYYYATYDNVTGLAVSAPVNVNGFKVGQVRSILYMYDNPGHVKVELSLDAELKVPEGSEAALVTDMLGTSTIELKLAPGTQIQKVGTELKAVRPKGLMDGISQDVMPAVTNLVPKIDSLLTTANMLLADPALLASIKRMDAITANLQASTVSLNRTMAVLPPISQDVKTITGNFVGTSDQLLTFTNTLNRVPVDTLAMQLQETTNNLKLLTQQLNNPNGTLGKISNDPALYNNLNSTVQALDSLLVDIKKNPKRYISIKLL